VLHFHFEQLDILSQHSLRRGIIADGLHDRLDASVAFEAFVEIPGPKSEHAGDNDGDSQGAFPGIPKDSRCCGVASVVAYTGPCFPRDKLRRNKSALRRLPQAMFWS